MSSIERLRIQGIRSFGPGENDKSVIKFSSPLTLILGQNGCGKTTIIEALKYAVCGELPGGTDGGSGFVHDPKLADQHLVKGNVRLDCRDVKGNAINVSRTVQVQQKLTKLEFKSLDSSITKGEGNSKQASISGKHVDVDGTMCEALGTSQAVLTNVIFCHQEDSLWPLEKGKKVKEKFDAIFGITEYNKCLDYFRSTSKDLEQKKSLVKKDVDHTHKFWTEAKEKGRKLEDLKGKEAAYHDEVKQIEEEIGPINEQIKEIIYKETNYAEHQAEMKGKEDRRKLIVETIDELKKDIGQEFSGSKDELINEIHNFEERLKETTDRLGDLNSEKTDILAEETRVQKDINGKSMLMGQLQRDEDEQKRNVEARNKCLRDLGNELEVNVISSSQLTASSSDDALRDIENKIKMLHTGLENQREEQSRFETQIQNKIDTIREKKATLTQDVKMKRSTIENNRREIEKIEAEIAEVDKNGDKLANLEKNLKEVDEQLTVVVASLNADQCKADIEKANEDLKKLDEKLTSVDREIRQLHQINLERANFNKLTERQKLLEDELNALEKKHHGTLQHLLTSIPGGDVKPALQTRINELNEEIRTHEREINQIERKLSVLKEQKRNIDEQIKQKKKNISADEDTINERLCGKNVKDYYEETLRRLKEAHDKKGQYDASNRLFKTYLDKLRSEDRVCPLCRRDFSTQAECEEIIEDLEKRLEKIPQQLQATNNLVDTLTADQKTASELQPVYDGIQKMKTQELPKLKSNLEAIESEIQTVESQLKSHQESLIAPQADREMASKILPDTILMDQRKKEIQTLKRDIENLQDKLPSVASGKTLDQATDEQDKLKLDVENLREKLNNDQRTLSSYNDRVNKLRERKTDLTAQQLKIAGSVQKRKTLTERLKELNWMQATLRNELEQVQAQLEPINAELEKESRTLVEMRKKHQLRLEGRRKEINDFEVKVKEIKDLQLKIANYAKEGGSKRLIDTKKELEEKRRQKDELESRKNKIEKELEKHKKFQSTHELQKRDLDANLKLRNKSEELIKVEEEIKKLKGQVNVLNYGQLKREREQKEKKIRELALRKSNIEGQLQNLQSTIKDVVRELNQPDYKNAEEEYRKSVVKLTVISKSVEDLRVYEKAMDWAMVHFHKERLKMINGIVRELWRSIYRGNDIDYIEIKTSEAKTNSAAVRRNYDYKVIQQKNGIEIDMPGRCSAGQKVLACLIIRMALAETFCKNCGILALDEPTTNLDRENIDSLSEALAEIVERRSAERKFQLLVITHDEEFLRKLFRVERVDSYLEVKRDNRGKSQVILRSAFM